MNSNENIKINDKVGVVGIIDGCRVALNSGAQYRVNINGESVWVNEDQIMGVIGRVNGKHESKG